MKVSFVIPCYRSEKTIKSVVEEIIVKMSSLNEYSYEIILVNDGSPDHTMDMIRQLCKNYNTVIGVDLAKNFGQHSALMAGYSLADGDFVVSLDLKDRTRVFNEAVDSIKKRFPQYTFYAVMDTDFAEE